MEEGDVEREKERETQRGRDRDTQKGTARVKHREEFLITSNLLRKPILILDI